jgi:hypothetical protein
VEVIDRTRSVGNSILEAPRAAVERGRSKPRLAVAAIVGVLLLIAWVAWAIYVTSDNGANAGLGVVLSWPVLLAALALIASPLIGLYFLLRALRPTDEAGEEPSIAGASTDAEAEPEEEPEAEPEAEPEEEPEAEPEEEPEAEAEHQEVGEGDEDPDEDADGEGEEEPEETDPDEEPPSGEAAKVSDQD